MYFNLIKIRYPDFDTFRETYTRWKPEGSFNFDLSLIIPI